MAAGQSSFLSRASSFDTSIATDKRNVYNETGLLTLTYSIVHLFKYKYQLIKLGP
jgi:hypothetical protein